MKKLIISLLAAGAVAGAAATPAVAGPDGPAKACVPLLETGLFSPQSSQGACRSTTATRALENGGFPSNAAAVDNCKQLERTFFVMGKPAGARPYPYSFYGAPQLTAYNRADCVAILRRIHAEGPPV